MMESMKNASIKTIWVILPIVLFFLFSCASTQKKKTEARDAEFYNNRGIAYDEEGQYDQAILDYNKALEINPRYAEAYNNRGVAYANKGQYDQAISDYNKALEINPRFAAPYQYRGNTYMTKGLYNEAFSDYSKALEINPKIAEAYQNRGIIYMTTKGNIQKACSDFIIACGLGLCKSYTSAKTIGLCQ